MNILLLFHKYNILILISIGKFAVDNNETETTVNSLGSPYKIMRDWYDK